MEIDVSFNAVVIRRLLSHFYTQHWVVLSSFDCFIMNFLYVFNSSICNDQHLKSYTQHYDGLKIRVNINQSRAHWGFGAKWSRLNLARDARFEGKVSKYANRYKLRPPTCLFNSSFHLNRHFKVLPQYKWLAKSYKCVFGLITSELNRLSKLLSDQQVAQ